MNERERTLTLNISDEDYLNLLKKCGIHSITPEVLLENFISDLVYGKNCNGSDESIKVQDWFNRCWFGMFPEETLLKYLLEYGPEPEELFFLNDAISSLQEELKELESDPVKNILDIRIINEEINDSKVEYQEIINKFLKKKHNADLEKEIKSVEKWIQRKRELLEERD